MVTTTAGEQKNLPSHRSSWVWFRWTCYLIVTYILVTIITTTRYSSSTSSRTSSLTFLDPNSLLENGVETELKQEEEQQGIDNVIENKTTSSSVAADTSQAQAQVQEDDSSYYWWKKHVNVIARPFQPSNDTDWCQPFIVKNKPTTKKGNHFHNQPENKYVPAQTRVENKNGMFYIRVPKAASSTLLGIAVQISKNVAKRLLKEENNILLSRSSGMSSIDSSSTTAAKKTTKSNTILYPEICNHHVDHGFEYTKRVRPYFLWTMIRHPTKRAISNYFFTLSRSGGSIDDVTDSTLKQYFNIAKNFQFEYLIQNSTKIWKESTWSSRRQVGIWKAVHDFSSSSSSSSSYHDRIIDEIQTFILERYHFIGIVERMDESLAVLTLLFDFIHVEDVIAFSAKKQSENSYVISKDKTKCQKLIPSTISLPSTPSSSSSSNSSAIEKYLVTNFERNNYDFFLYDTINKSLDMTINMLGVQRVQEQVQQIRTIRQLVEYQCQNETHFPCANMGILTESYKQNCYAFDSGCGHACIQEMVQKHL